MSDLFIKKPARTASPVVRQLFDLIDGSGLSHAEIAAITGVHRVTLSFWKHGKNAPRLLDFENVAQSLGYEIQLKPAALSDSTQ